MAVEGSPASALLRVQLDCSTEQCERLRRLQVAFAEVCNRIAPVVQETRCWNRVALHHMLYRNLREQFPAMGSQMVCNAIYSVSRSARAVLQHPSSPWNIQRQPKRPLPLMRFSDTAPVYFDRHTLSIRDQQLSMFTLDGRMRFDLKLRPSDESRFQREKLLEVVLSSTGRDFTLSFRFSANGADALRGAAGEFPEYLVIIPATPDTEDLSALYALPEPALRP